MKKFPLSLTAYLIWEERNKMIFDGNSRSVAMVFCKFQVFFYMVLHFHEQNHFLLDVG